MIYTALHTMLATSSETNDWVQTLLGFLPIALFLLVLYFVFRRQTQSPTAKLQRENVEKHIQHMQRVEELLERIAKALEQRR